MIIYETKESGIVVKEYGGSAHRFYGNDEIIQDWKGSYDDEVTIEEAFKSGRLKIVQDGMMRGTSYYD